jgi:hypothetical protein
VSKKKKKPAAKKDDAEDDEPPAEKAPEKIKIGIGASAIKSKTMAAKKTEDEPEESFEASKKFGAKPGGKPFFRQKDGNEDKDPPVKQMAELLPEVAQLPLEVSTSKPSLAPKTGKVAAAAAAAQTGCVDIFDVDSMFAPAKPVTQPQTTPYVQPTTQQAGFQDDEDDEDWGFTAAKQVAAVSVGTSDATLASFISGGQSKQQAFIYLKKIFF